MDEELLKRIQRLHVAIGRTSTDLRKIPPEFYDLPRRRLSDAELSETLHSLIHNVASFHDHLQSWGDRHGATRSSIHDYLKSSFDFCVVTDLWNNDKHGYPRQNDGWTDHAPQLLNVNSICQLKTQPKKESSVVIQIGKSGQPNIGGDGSVHVIITGEVVDKDGVILGDAHIYIEKAIRHCEAALQHFDVVDQDNV